jgi:hypothetical protein
MTEVPLNVSEYMASLGRAKNKKKGFGSMTPEQRREASRKSAEARRKNKQRKG